MAGDPRNLIWIDLEMTGLDTRRDQIIEIAAVVTTSELEVVAEGPAVAIHQSDEVLAAMDGWNTEHHTRSGLLKRVRRSKWTEADAERAMLAFVAEHVPQGASPMCGNSVCQDRRFLSRFMPALERHFHYRNLDVSSVKEMCMRWAPELAGGFAKQSAHRALADIHDSIRELQYYRDRFFKLE